MEYENKNANLTDQEVRVLLDDTQSEGIDPRDIEAAIGTSLILPGTNEEQAMLKAKARAENDPYRKIEHLKRANKAL